MNKSLTDEELMAFVDGELAPAATARLLEEFSSTPDLQERLSVFTQSRNLLEGLYGSHASEPVPEHLIATIRDFDVPRQTTWLSAFKQRASRLAQSVHKFADEFATPRVATVAAMMLIAGVLVGRTNMMLPGDGTVQVGDQQVVQIGPIAPRSQLALALASTASGDTFEWRTEQSQASLQLTPILTFQSNSQEYCRQFTLSSSAASAVSAVACINSDKNWHILSAAAHTKKPAAPSGYQTASGSGSPEIVATLSRLMADVPLELDQERRLIQSRWQSK